MTRRALPAIAAALDGLPAGTRALAFVEVAGPEEEQPDLALSPGTELRWLHRGDAAPGEALVAAVLAAELPAGRGHLFVHGEAYAVRELRRHLRGLYGLAPGVDVDLRLLAARRHRGRLAVHQAGVERADRGRGGPGDGLSRAAGSRRRLTSSEATDHPPAGGPVRAAQISTLDGPRAIQVVDVPEPEAGDKVLIDVHVAGVTYPEVLQSRGEYQMKPPLPFTPGSEVAGVVRSAPEGSGFTAGQRVAAFPSLGGFAEVVAAAPSLVFAAAGRRQLRAGRGAADELPDRCTSRCAAAVDLREGESVLVHGAAGGLGTAAVQLAKAYGARVLAVVSSDAKGEVARAAGADEIVPADGFRDAVKELTGGTGVDVVVDPVGGDRFTDSLRSLGREGRILVLGFTGGEIPTVKVNRLLLNNVSVVGVGWGAFWSMGAPGFPQEQWEELYPLLESGRLDPVLGIRAPARRTSSTAVTELDERRAAGKVLLRVRD